ncbi:MAG: hypothetical protein JNK97_08835 [Zoogloea sp.]|nr:hypothetical protein [Zoogloea sp.]
MSVQPFPEFHMYSPLVRSATALLSLAVAGILTATPAEAGGRYGGPPRGYPSGHWHGHHNDFNSLWWIAGTGLLLYPFVTPPRTVVIEQPEPVVAPAAPAAQNWYYCDSAKAYYPYVESCAEGWRAVPSTPPATPAPAPAASGTWYYCDAAGAYYPYVQECPSGWRATPATSGSPVPQGARR